MPKYYKQTIQQLIKHFQTSKEGLSTNQARNKLSELGRNKIKVRGRPLWKKLLEPFFSVFMLILGIAIVISVLTNETIDAVIIGSIILITVIIYYVQRFSTDRVLRALQQHDIQMISTYRDGQVVEIDSEELVPGDVILLDEGQKVPADSRIMIANNARTDEALLTGESMPVQKHANVLEKDKQVYEQSNMLFQGSYVVSGSITALVVATGNATQFGQLAALTRGASMASPVKKKIDMLISQIVGAVVVLAGLVFLLSFYRGMEVAESMRLVLTFSVSAIPESLPIAISVVLVLGMRRMAKHKALVRSMSAIENVGIITTIATDKTGTLTKNQLSVQDVWTLTKNADLQQLAKAVYLSINQSKGKLHDPLDSAFKHFADKYLRDKVEGYELEKTLPFELQHAKSGNIFRHKGKYATYIKGAPEKILASCDITKAEHSTITQKLHSLTGSGYRVIALARLPGKKAAVLELKDLPDKGFEFICLVAVADQLRPEAKESVRATQNAGVTVRMITGDHFETAFAIGRQLGLAEHREQVLDCTNLEDMSDEQLKQQVSKIRVFSRVLPQHKHRILGILKETDIAAMTGDGVNDVPALTNAHIGIAMGSGSQIAKEAGDIVLLDDNFKSITSALRGGRVIFDNIQRMLFYLLSTNLGEVLTTVMALIVGLPLPLLPVQILWTNLGTDTAMVIPLGLEPSEKDVMKRKPRRPKSPIISKLILSRMLLIAVTMTTVALISFSYFLQFESETYARTVVFSALVVMQLTNAINARSMWQSVFVRLRTANYSIFIGLFAALALYVLAVFSPLSSALQLEQLRLGDLLTIWAISIAAIVAANETHKFIGRKYFGKG